MIANLVRSSLEERSGQLKHLSGVGRQSRGFTEGLGDLNPVDFDLAFNKWPLHQFLIWIAVRNLYVKDEHLHYELQKAASGVKTMM